MLKKNIGSFANILIAPYFIWISLFFIIPAIYAIAALFYSYSNYSILEIIQKFRLFKTAIITFLFIIFCATISLSISSVLFYISIKSSDKFALRVFWLMLTISQISFIARCFAYRLLFSQGFFINKALRSYLPFDFSTFFPLFGWTSVILITILLTTSMSYISIHQSVFQNYNRNILLAADDLGASNIKKFIKIFLPSIKDALVYAYYISVSYCLGSYFVPSMVGSLDNLMLENHISEVITVTRNITAAVIFSVVLIALTFLSYWTGEKAISYLLGKSSVSLK
ncbi:MAG: hypothetical protein KAH32_06520 [Chlamydiia bacterium]|nr:hypothetical protein [Chlamydiia bacterium]